MRIVHRQIVKPRHMSKTVINLVIQHRFIYLIRFYCFQMMKIKAKKQRNKSILKTQPDVHIQPEIRVSLADPAKQKLMEISSINNHLAQSHSRDWDEDQSKHGNKLNSFNRRCYETIAENSKGLQRRKYKQCIGVDHLRKFNKTQSSIRDFYDDNPHKACNSINLQFQRMVRQREARIHSNGQVSIQFDNNTFNISQKLLREAAFKTQNQFNRLPLFYQHKNMKRLKDRFETRTPIIPYKKLTTESAYLRDNSELFSLEKAKELKNDLARRKEFLDLSSILVQEKRNLFYPTKVNLTKGKAGKSCS